MDEKIHRTMRLSSAAVAARRPAARRPASAPRRRAPKYRALAGAAARAARGRTCPSGVNLTTTRACGTAAGRVSAERAARTHGIGNAALRAALDSYLSLNDLDARTLKANIQTTR